MRFKAQGATLEQYEQVNAIMGIAGDDTAPDGLIQHVAADTGDGIVVVDVWESEEKLNRFFEERLGAALAQAGLESGQPEILRLHNFIPRGSGTEPNVLMEVRVGAGPAVYDELVSRMPTHVGDGSGHPVYSHAAAVTADGGMYIHDLWDSPEAFGAFAQGELGPAAGDSLGEIQPTFTPVVNVIRGRAAVPA
jgi:heme-degrading monooxygenase HmoA